MVHYFDNGLAAVMNDRKWGYVDTKGIEVVPLLYSKFVAIKTNSKLDGKIDSTIVCAKKNRFWGHLHLHSGTEIGKFHYKEVFSFCDGLALVVKGRKYGCIDKHGKEVIPPIYNDFQGFHEDVAAAKQGALWGYINRQNEVLIPFQFDRPGIFKNGKAYVWKGKNKFWIDKNGNCIEDCP